jgi:hypothetical protein
MPLTPNEFFSTEPVENLELRHEQAVRAERMKASTDAAAYRPAILQQPLRALVENVESTLFKISKRERV